VTMPIAQERMDSEWPGAHTTRMGKVPRTAVLAGCAVIVLAGCAARQTTAPTAAAVSSAAVATGRATAAPGPSASQRADADAAAILASFPRPQGARRLTDPPAAAYGVLAETPTAYPGPYIADRTSWWQVPGQPGRVLGWVRAHLPSRFMFSDAWSGGTGGTVYEWGDDFWLPPVPGVLDSRMLVVSVVNAGGGQTAIRVDGQVAWQPPKSAGELVPPAARMVTVTKVRGSLPGPLPAPVTITNVTRARWIAGLVNGLPFQGVPKVCALHSPGALHLTFRARSGGPALAVFTGELWGCYGLLTVGGETRPAILNDGDTFVTHEMLAVAGMRWPAY
jgi:hypothetical protein